MLRGIVIDKYGKVLSDEELKNKVIDIPEYYDFILPIRKKLNKQFFDKNKEPKSC